MKMKNHTKKFRIKQCLKILNNPEKAISVDIDNIYVFNKYNLKSIPTWVYRIISVCTDIEDWYNIYAPVIFDELMNSISERKFNGDDIPSDYIIVPDDWADCYEDGYPILEIIDGDLNELTDEYLQKFNHLLDYGASEEDLTKYLLWLLKQEGCDEVIRCILGITLHCG